MSDHPRFTKKEQTIYEEAQRAAAAGDLLTVGELARRAGVAPSSATKFAKKLGYMGWPALRKSLALEYDRHTIPSGPLKDTMEEIAEDLAEKADRPIFVYGAGTGSFAASYLEDRLDRRGFLVVPYGKQAMLAHADKGGIVFVVNETGLLLAPDVKLANELGYDTVGITGRGLSPVAREADVAVIIKSNKVASSEDGHYDPNFFAARVMAFVELLMMGVPWLHEASLKELDTMYGMAPEG